MKTVAITDLYNVCVDISFVKRLPVDGIVQTLSCNIYIIDVVLIIV